MNPLVSVCCITYNHQEYIRDAIEGFLIQKTDFPFEIIIHDDASTDQTARIIGEYEKKYPKLIKPIYQAENQYSKGERVFLNTFKKASGKYIAICEGDDYWIDPLKLQKQVTIMEKHPECDISFHPAIRRWMNGDGDKQLLGFHSVKTSIFSIHDVIMGGGGFMPTASIMIRNSIVPKLLDFFYIAKEAPIGDYYMQVIGTERGGALYLDEVMSVYRTGIPGSFSDRITRDSSKLAYFLETVISSNNKLNMFTNELYSKSFDAINRQYYSSVIKSLDIDVNIKKSILEKNITKIGIKNRILWSIIFKHLL